jgi:ADP-heptose:LPS heptosyltransferase
VQHALALGPAIHSTPLIRALPVCVPGARVTTVASGFALEVLRGNPAIEQMSATPNPLTDLRCAVRAWRAAKLFAGEPYVALYPVANERTLLYVAGMFSGAHVRVGHAVLPELATASLPFDRSISLIGNNLQIIEALGHGSALREALSRDPELCEPQVFPSKADRVAAAELLTACGLDPAQPLAVFITQTSPTQRKSWRAERFQAVAEWLYARHGLQIVFAGTRSESAAIDEIRHGLSFPTANVAGRTSLLQLAALMGLADIAVTLDTGPMHLLRAMRVPMVVIAPAWSPAIEWLPLGNPRARILKNADLPTAPHDYIIDEVSVDEVKRGLDELLTIYPPRTR